MISKISVFFYSERLGTGSPNLKNFDTPSSTNPQHTPTYCDLNTSKTKSLNFLRYLTLGLLGTLIARVRILSY